MRQPEPAPGDFTKQERESEKKSTGQRVMRGLPPWKQKPQAEGEQAPEKPEEAKPEPKTPPVEVF